VPGQVNSLKGIVFTMPNLSGWDHDVLLRDRLAEHLKKPIYIENDANAAALGEYLFGAGRGCNFMVYLTISTGLGGGVIMNGQVMRGISGAAMEIGHMTIHEFGEPCNCGNIGCLETVASGIAIVQRANEALKSDQSSGFLAFKRNARMQAQSRSPAHDQTMHEHDENVPDWLPSIDAKAVAEAAEAGVPFARAIIRSAAEGLGIGLVNVIHIFNPEKIILGGGLTQIGRHMLIDPAIKIAQERAMKVQRDAVSIEEAQLGIYAGLVGAGVVAYQNIDINIQPSRREP
jgi:glucokinase